MNARRIVQAGLFGILALTPASSKATSELHKEVRVGFVGEFVFRMNAGSNFGFQILDTGNDAYTAVIDVFSYPSRAFLAEGFPSTGGESRHTAGVVFSAVNSDRLVYVVVRPLADLGTTVTLRGTRTVASTPDVSASRDFPLFIWVEPSARVSIPSGLITNTHVWTTEENVQSGSVTGTNDTVLMVLQDDIPLAFDDDSGLTRMSWLHLFQPCLAGSGHNCQILVAQRSNDKGGLSPGDPGYDVPSNYVYSRHTTLAWDEDVHNGRDQDRDGLGDALEDYLLTDKANPDSDADGIPDGVEVIGVADKSDDEETKTNLLRFPYYGASPTHKDIFVEADWAPGCAGSPPDCLPSQKNQWRLQQDKATYLTGLFPPEIRVHIDTGLANPPGGTSAGDWGGANLLGDNENAANYCTGWSNNRRGYFTHTLAGEGAQNSGRCTAINNDPSTDVHELGHYTGLAHWGDPEGTKGKTNCKPHYFSVMNYNYQELANDPGGGKPPWLGPTGLFPTFSKGLYKNLALNAFALDETAGLGDNPPNQNALEFLDKVVHLIPPSAKDTSGNYTGAVDWNANGVIEPGIVKGVLNVPIAANPSGDCDPSPPTSRRSYNVHQIALPTISVDNGLLHISGLVPMRYSSQQSKWLGPSVIVGVQPDLSRCANKGIDDCARWPTANSGVVVDTTPAPGLYAPAVAGGIVVYADKDGKLFYFHAPTSTTSISTTAVGGPPISGDPVAIQRPSGLVTVYAPSNGLLRRWDYNPSIGLWTQLGGIEYWTSVDGTKPEAVGVPNAGIGLAWGYQLSLPGETQFPSSNLYAAIMTPQVGGRSPVVLARLDADEQTISVPMPPPLPPFSIVSLNWSYWVPLSAPAARIPTEFYNIVPSRIGLAFRPDNPAAAEPKPGRFYVTWQYNMPCVGGTVYPNQPGFAVSRGNRYSDTQDLDIPQSLVFDRAGKLANEWTSYPSGASLVYFDGSVRGVQQTLPAYEYKCGNPPAYDPMRNPMMTFYPHADGIFNYDQYDHDDVSYMQSHVSWALRQ